jgi:hypothetical protein
MYKKILIGVPIYVDKNNPKCCNFRCNNICYGENFAECGEFKDKEDRRKRLELSKNNKWRRCAACKKAEIKKEKA